MCRRCGKPVGTQPVFHTVYTSTTRWINIRHITASSVTPHRINNINSQYLIITHFNPYLYYLHNINRGPRWRSWLRHCATSQKVAGSIPDGVIGIFHLHNPSSRTMALGLTQPLTERVPGIFPGG